MEAVKKYIKDNILIKETSIYWRWEPINKIRFYRDIKGRHQLIDSIKLNKICYIRLEDIKSLEFNYVGRKKISSIYWNEEDLSVDVRLQYE